MHSCRWTVLAVLALGACAATPGAKALETANYGPTPTASLAARIREAFRPLLLDPDQAEFRCGEPEQGWGHDQKGCVYGWVIWTDVNAKNQFGAFTGWRTYKVLTVDSEVHSIYEPEGQDLFGQPKFNKVR